jgi:hypothetical protein
MEETPVVQEALRRLPKDVLAARTFRHKRAFQVSLTHSELPQEYWVKPEEVQFFWFSRPFRFLGRSIRELTVTIFRIFHISPLTLSWLKRNLPTKKNTTI